MACVLVLVACGDEDEPFVGSTTEVSTPATPYSHLVALRIGTHDGFTRVVFEFRDGVPGHRIGYRDRPVIQDGSGDEVAVDGDAVLLAHFEASSTFDLDTSKPTYDGPQRVGGRPPVAEVVRVSDFEANLDFAIGVDGGNRPFKVTTLTNPSRVVVDVSGP